MTEHNNSHFECIVIGAGGIGSATAYHLARDGRRVLLLEQFEVGHKRGSSHGESRVIRYTHDVADYARHMPATFELWRELEQESGEQLLLMTGGVFMAPADGTYQTGVQKTLRELDFPFTLHSRPALANRYPQFRMPEGWQALEQEHTGVLAASRCVQTLVRQAQGHGAILREHATVSAIRPQTTGGGIEIALSGPTGNQLLRTDQVFLCAGPWTPAFLGEFLHEPVNLRITHQQVVYYPTRDAAAHAPGKFPVFLFAGDALTLVYGMPSWERTGTIKIALEQDVKTLDPNDPERPIDQELLQRLNGFVEQHLPGVIPQPVHAEACLYTETPDHDFIIDRHPQHPGLFIAAGFCGRGFKHTIAIGRLLADLSKCRPGEYDSPFWAERFRLGRL